MVIWLIGLSGSGKTSIALALTKHWKKASPNTVMVDGDDMREIFNHTTGPDSHTVAGRRINAERITEICAWLDRQQINVVCSILSIFPDMRARNREYFSKYFEVFLDADMETLMRRDTKLLYAQAKTGETTNVVGVDIPFPTPTQSDLTIDANIVRTDFEPIAQTILDQAIGQ